jgi:hypothetical protein
MISHQVKAIIIKASYQSRCKGYYDWRIQKSHLPDLRQGYQIDITITRDAKGEKTKSKNSTWITINRRISPTSPLSPPASNLSSNNDGNCGDTPSAGGDITFTSTQVSPAKQPNLPLLILTVMARTFRLTAILTIPLRKNWSKKGCYRVKYVPFKTIRML